MIDNSTFGNRTALFHTLGCKLNFSETSTVAKMLADRGIRRAQTGENPDIIVVNTCSVTELADKKSRQAIRSLSKRYPQAAVLVTGCYAQLKSKEAISLPGVAVVAGTDQKDRLAEFLDNWIKTRQPQTVVTPTRDIRRFIPSCSHGDRTRYFLKVQDGCDYFCTYCTIPMARGRSRSGSIEDITRQAMEVAAEGGREIVLTGVNIGDFGKGRDDSFLDLIKRLDEVEGIERYRISSIEPNLLTEDIIDFVARSRSFMPHFHIPLQSGSDRVLSLMRRHYDTALFRSRIEKIRQTLPDAFIGVDLIAGARGETPEEFDASRKFIASLDVSQLHVFPYSERPGTKALGIDHTVTQEEKHRRTRVMLNLSEEKLAQFANRFIGQTRPVLLEHGSHEGVMSGFTDNYLKVRVKSKPSTDNTIVRVRLNKVINGGEEIAGEVVE